MLMNQQLFHNRDQPNLENKFENIDIRKKENSRCRSSVVGMGNKSLASCMTRRRRATAAFESRLLSSYKNKKVQIYSEKSFTCYCKHCFISLNRFFC